MAVWTTLWRRPHQPREIAITPRSIAQPNTVLWTLENPQRLPPLAIRQFVARCHDANDIPVGALELMP